MQITLTVADPTSATTVDLLLDADPSTPLGDVAAVLARHLGTALPVGGPVATVHSLDARRGGPGRSVTTDGAVTHPAGVTPAAVTTVVGTALYVDGVELEADQQLGGSPLRDGALVSLGDPGACTPAEPDGRVEIRVVGGPGAGTLHRLPVSELTIGSDPACGIRIEAPDVAPVAARVVLEATGTTTVAPADPSATGTATGTASSPRDGDPTWSAPALDGAPLTEGVTWPVAGQLAVGPVLLELELPTPPDAALQPSADGGGLDYNRPPRLLPPLRQTTFRLPPPPEEQGRRRLPWIAALAPMVMGVTMALIWRRPYFLMFAFMSPVIMLANWFYDRRSGRESHRRKLATYRERRAGIEADAREALVTERLARRAEAPDAAALLLTAIGPRSRLWERRRDDPDHLVVRVGTGSLDSEVTLVDPEQPEHRRTVTWTALDVPVTIPLRERGVAGIAGRGDLPRRLAAWVVAQLAVLQSPRDVQLYVLTEPAVVEAWAWVRWLPHARPQAGQDTVALLGADTETLGRRLAELTAMITARTRARQDSSGALLDEPDVVVVLDGARRLRSLPGVVQLLKDGPAVGVHALCLDVDRRLLPEECTAVVEQTAVGLRLEQQRTESVEEVRPDLVPWRWFPRVARALAPIRDVSDTGEDSALPAACRLLDVLDLEPPTAQAVAARWTLGGRTTRAVVGESLDGPFALDLRRDGPHGLVAGTTGAGKSELLQTLVASLAVANRPDAMTFVLVDYKGGAAFKDCVDLPHTVGMVTDLDTHLVERALTSLGAELRRREHLLASAGAKDIEDYTDLQGRDHRLAPLPRLLLVVDEFASMARELPDFVTGLVNIAQRGRSLGIHLLLATQRPSGVVSPEIRANTNLRIALRVTDPAESSDVIDAPDAARIAKSTPGRAYARLGHASLVPFQAARVGGRRPGGGPITPDGAPVLPGPWLATVGTDRLGHPGPRRPEAVRDAGQIDVTDLAVLVDAVRAASERLGVPPQHSPWLPALGDRIVLAEVETLTGGGAAPGTGGPATIRATDGSRLPPIPYGLVDLPAEQARRAAVLDLDTDGHLFVIGSPRSGRSQVLRTIAASAARRIGTGDVHLYGLDCGNGALLPLTSLPHCGAVVQRTQVERAQRLLGRLAAEVARRQEVLGETGCADLTEQRTAAQPEDRLPHVIVLLDRWEGFTSGLGDIDGGALHDQVLLLLREGASVGVHLVLAGDRSLLSGRLSTMTEDKLVLRLADRTDYSLAGLVPRHLPEEIPPGRGFRAESGEEVQVALLGSDPAGAAQAEDVRRLAAEVRARDTAVSRARRPFRVDVLPARLGFADAWRMRDDETPRPLWGMVGVGGDELVALGPDLQRTAPTFVVAGPAKSGRSTVLLTMARSFLAQDARVVIATPRASPLRDLDGTPGVLAVFTGTELTPEQLEEALDTGGTPAVLLMDDAELLRDVSGKDWLRQFVRTCGDRRQAVVIAGNALEVCNGFTGWQVDIKKNRQGALLCPQQLTDSDLVGYRLPRSLIGGPVQPGRAHLHLGDGELVTVQVPLTTAG